jgi:hypothetical protein
MSNIDSYVSRIVKNNYISKADLDFLKMKFRNDIYDVFNKNKKFNLWTDYVSSDGGKTITLKDLKKISDNKDFFDCFSEPPMNMYYANKNIIFIDRTGERGEKFFLYNTETQKFFSGLYLQFIEVNNKHFFTFSQKNKTSNTTTSYLYDVDTMKQVLDSYIVFNICYYNDKYVANVFDEKDKKTFFYDIYNKKILSEKYDSKFEYINWCYYYASLEYNQLLYGTYQNYYIKNENNKTFYNPINKKNINALELLFLGDSLDFADNNGVIIIKRDDQKYIYDTESNTTILKIDGYQDGIHNFKGEKCILIQVREKYYFFSVKDKEIIE